MKTPDPLQSLCEMAGFPLQGEHRPPPPLDSTHPDGPSSRNVDLRVLGTLPPGQLFACKVDARHPLGKSANHSAYEMTYIMSGGALNSTHSFTHRFPCRHFAKCVNGLIDHFFVILRPVAVM